MISRIIFFMALVCGPLTGFAQDCCDPDTKLILCYTSQDDYCTFSTCNYTFDGFNMAGISKKLANENLFGDAGFVPCPVTPVALRNISSVADIEDQACDIVLIGNFAGDNNAGFGTTLPNSFLRTVREWSLKCEENLTILFQGEAEIWGYQIDDENENPNFPGAAVTPNIFDGTFGSITQFNQGGSFQANFDQLATTGSTVLAVDNLGRPTIVLDTETNDIIMSDVGIICNSAGLVSNSPDILNSNDVLACNIFALGCEIADNATLEEEEVSICLGQNYILPNGTQVSMPGVYTSSFIDVNGCDSLITTVLDVDDQIEEFISYQGCDQDGYSELIGNSRYDQSNPSGQERLITDAGCDSIINVEFQFYNNEETFVDTSFCTNTSITINGVNLTESDVIIENLFTVNGCDSIVEYDVQAIPFPVLDIPSEIEIINNDPFTFSHNVPSDLNVEWSPSSGLNCTNCPNPTISNTDYIEAYTLTITSEDGCVQDFQIQVNYVCDIYFPNVFSLQSIDNNGFQVFSKCALQEFSLSIYDRWGNVVFVTQDQYQKWDGSKNGKYLSQGVFAYTLSYTHLSELVTQSGTVTILK